MKSVVREKGSYSRYAGINPHNGNVIEEKIPIHQAFMPYSTRSQIDTEGRATAGSQAILGSEKVSARKKITAKYGDNTYDLNLFKYRFDDEKMLIPDVASMDTVGIFKSGGGFDLDDHFINNLKFIEDSQGARHLASFAWRQPTGPQEYALLTPHLDDKTIERMFGSDTVVGERFRRLSAGVSELLDIPNAVNGLEQREINTFKYINSLAHGQKKAADMYKPESITQEELSNALFRIFDIGGEEKFKLGDRAKAVSTADFARDFLGTENANVEGIFLNDITKLNETVARLASKGSGSSPLTMSIEEIKNFVANDAELAAGYRESQLTQILSSKVTLPSDNIYVEKIEDIYGRAYAGGHPNVNMTYSDFKEAVRKSRKASDRELTPMEYAYRAQKQLTSGVGLENQLGLEAKNAFNMYYTRMQTRSITAESGLGKYINRLGWLASGEDQRIAGAKSILEYANKEGANEDLVKIANELVNSTFLVWNPENAIDAGIGLGEVGLGVTYQDMLNSYVSARRDLPREVAEQALNTALFAMHNPNEEGYRVFIDKHINAKGYSGSLKGLTGEALEDAIYTNRKELFHEMLAENPEGLMDFINVSAENIGGTNIGEVAGSLAKIRAYQLGLGIAGEGDVSLVGLDRTAALYKLSTIRKKGSPISDYDMALASITDTYTEAIVKMKELADSGKVTLNESGYNQLVQELEELTKLATSDGLPALSGREKLIDLLGMGEKAQAKYGVINVEKQLQAAQDIAQAFRSEMRLKQFNIYKSHESSLATTELSEAIGKIRSDIGRSLGDTTLTELREKSSLLRKMEEQSLNGSFSFDDWMGKTLSKYGYATGEDIARTRTTKNWGELQSVITDKINMEMSEAQATIGQAVQRGFQEAADTEGASPVSLMKKMLYEIEQMKISERVDIPNETQRTTAFLGKQLDFILKNESNLSINIGSEAVTIQQLASVTMNQMVVDQTYSLEQSTQNMVEFINNVKYFQAFLY
jgi:hypothetical protein